MPLVYISEIEDIDAKTSRGYDTCLRMRKTATTSRKQKGPEATEVERANRRREREGSTKGEVVGQLFPCLAPPALSDIRTLEAHSGKGKKRERKRESEREGGNTQEKLDSM